MRVYNLNYIVFTLQSIKSRIETKIYCRKCDTGFGFLLYSPLNQGLKRDIGIRYQVAGARFLLYSPLNQGLKPLSRAGVNISPIVFTLQSIKSRIETMITGWATWLSERFLLYSPLNQGLKQDLGTIILMI